MNIPFKSNNNSEEDGAVEDDVVDRVEKLWEKYGIELTVIWEGPLELWKEEFMRWISHVFQIKLTIIHIKIDLILIEIATPTLKNLEDIQTNKIVLLLVFLSQSPWKLVSCLNPEKDIIVNTQNEQNITLHEQ